MRRIVWEVGKLRKRVWIFSALFDLRAMRLRSVNSEAKIYKISRAMMVVRTREGVKRENSKPEEVLDGERN